jgi:hypothetical protein
MTGVLVSACAVVTSAAGSHSRTQATRFTSRRYGYSLVVPPGWVAHRAVRTVASNSAYFPYADDATVDHFTAPGQDGGTIAVSATRVRASLTLKAWSAGTPQRVQLSLGCKPKGPIPSKVGGQAAAVFSIPPICGGSGDAYVGIDYAVAHRGYGYDLQVVSVPSHQMDDRAVFEQTLKTFRFTQ